MGKYGRSGEMWGRNGEVCRGVGRGGEGRCRGCGEVWGRSGRVYGVSVDRG